MTPSSESTPSSFSAAISPANSAVMKPTHRHSATNFHCVVFLASIGLSSAAPKRPCTQNLSRSVEGPSDEKAAATLTSHDSLKQVMPMTFPMGSPASPHGGTCRPSSPSLSLFSVVLTALNPDRFQYSCLALFCPWCRTSSSGRSTSPPTVSPRPRYPR